MTGSIPILLLVVSGLLSEVSALIAPQPKPVT